MNKDFDAVEFQRKMRKNISKEFLKDRKRFKKKLQKR